MPRDNTIRWNLSVSRKADVAVRMHLAQRGTKKGDLSAFIEEAVLWRVLDQDLAEARGKFADLPPRDAQALIDEATDSIRRELRARLSR